MMRLEPKENTGSKVCRQSGLEQIAQSTKLDLLATLAVAN
jgi:hypothetical protein